jgi:ribonucleoside-diphosphate reductase beta chain
MTAEVPMHDDIIDWNTKLTRGQKDFLTNIFRFFTQGDVDVAEAYYTQYLPYFKLPEVTMMLGGFASRESIHIDAYSYLLETLGMPEATYKEFLTYKEMKDKHDYIKTFSQHSDLLSKSNLSIEDKEHIAASIALFSGFTEGMQLFSTFAMLLIFPLNGLMKGMGQIVTWSRTDEVQHVEGMIELFQTFLKENPDIRRDVLKDKIEKIAIEMVKLETAFIHLLFKTYDEKDFFALTSEKLIRYIEFIANTRLTSMGYDNIFETIVNPLPELAMLTDIPSHTNFFENTSTDYANTATTGSWNTIWDKN